MSHKIQYQCYIIEDNKVYIGEASCSANCSCTRKDKQLVHESELYEGQELLNKIRTGEVKL